MSLSNFFLTKDFKSAFADALGRNVNTKSNQPNTNSLMVQNNRPSNNTFIPTKRFGNTFKASQNTRPKTAPQSSMDLLERQRRSMETMKHYIQRRDRSHHHNKQYSNHNRPNTSKSETIHTNNNNTSNNNNNSSTNSKQREPLKRGTVLRDYISRFRNQPATSPQQRCNDNCDSMQLSDLWWLKTGKNDNNSGDSERLNTDSVVVIGKENMYAATKSNSSSITSIKSSLSTTNSTNSEANSPANSPIETGIEATVNKKKNKNNRNQRNEWMNENEGAVSGRYFQRNRKPRGLNGDVGNDNNSIDKQDARDARRTQTMTISKGGPKNRKYSNVNSIDDRAFEQRIDDILSVRSTWLVHLKR